eukprot:1189054-Prorocentrum_minimum.AAC.1
MNDGAGRGCRALTQVRSSRDLCMDVTLICILLGIGARGSVGGTQMKTKARQRRRIPPGGCKSLMYRRVVDHKGMCTVRAFSTSSGVTGMAV